MTSSSQYGNVNKELSNGSCVFGQAYTRFEEDCISKISSDLTRVGPMMGCAVLHTNKTLSAVSPRVISRPKFGAVCGTRRATKATQAVRYFPQEVSCGTNYAFAQNSTRDCTCHM